jgi:hypothetical protein
MPSLLSIFRTPIPGLKRRKPRVRKAPWIVRHCPERVRPMAEDIFLIAGCAAFCVLMMTALAAIIFFPLLLAHIIYPSRPINTAPIHLLREHFSHGVAFNIYLFGCFIIWAVLFYAWRVFDYLCKEALKRKNDNAA